MEKEAAIFFNFNDENIEDVRTSLEREMEEDTGNDLVFTMLQRNSPSKITITEDSRKICAGILTMVR